MNTRRLSAIEFYAGGLLTVFAVLLFINSYFCVFNKESCGMVEPIIAVFLLSLAAPIILAAWFHRRQKMGFAALAYIPVVIIIVVSIGQGMLWW